MVSMIFRKVSARLISTAILAYGGIGALAQAAPPTLCQSGETPVFSCAIGSKMASVCQSELSGSGATALQYRYGVVGQTPELVYPGRMKAAADAFSFETHLNGPMSVISFKNGNASYDVVSHFSADKFPKNDYDKNFTGIGVTVNDGTTQLKTCNAGDVVMDMRQLEKEGLFPKDDSFIPYEEKSPFKTVSSEATHGPKWTSTIKYPVIGDAALDQRIKSFLKYDCIWDDKAENERRDFGDTSADTDQQEGKCSRSVLSYVVEGRFLILIFSSFSYSAGEPHGQGDESIETYMREGAAWTHIEKNSLISSNPTCRKHYAALTNRHIRPQLTDEFAAQVAPAFDSLFEEAEQVLTPEGVLFHYGEYSLGPRNPPEGFLVDFKTLGACFAPRPGKDEDTGANG
jgi:hypothetical protein